MLVSVLTQVRESRLKSCFGVAHRRRMIRVMQPRLAFAFALALVIAGLVPRPVVACTCAGPITSAEALEASDVAFTGVVMDTYDPAGGSPYVSTGAPILYAFAVEEHLKGDSEEVIVVRSARDGSSCGFGFAIGERWTVYAHHWENEIWTGLCSSNEMIESGAAPPAGAGGSPLPPDTGLFPDAAFRLPLAALGGVLLLGTLAYAASLRNGGSSRGPRTRTGEKGPAPPPG
jgi:hypothetical protein